MWASDNLNRKCEHFQQSTTTKEGDIYIYSKLNHNHTKNDKAGWIFIPN